MLNRKLVCALVLLLPALALLKTPSESRARHNAGEAFAITNARIVPVAAPVIEKGTIVIRDGLIAAVGANVTAPADARIIDGAGLTVYPGLIDANTSLGMPQPSPAARPAGGGGGGGGGGQGQGGPSPMASALNSTQPAGLQPEIQAADYLRPGGEQIESERNAGITTVLTAPRTGIFIGQSAVINLDGDSAPEMIVRSPVALHVGFTSLRGGYPGSLMGVFAAIRQAFLDAQRYDEAQKIYARSPRGVRRPEPDKSLEALIPALNRAMPVVFHADRQREIERAIGLAQEFKLRGIIAGGEEAWKVADRLREAQMPVLLSLNFPRRTTAASAEADPEPLRVLRGRVEAPKSPARLATARVKFAFQSGGMTAIDDFRGNAAKAIENGLSTDDAIKAMTLSAAEILSVSDRMGSIEVGKIANLTITRGNLFDRASRIAYLFIDGRQIELRPAGPPAAPQSSPTATPAETPPPMAQSKSRSVPSASADGLMARHGSSMNKAFRSVRISN